MQWCGDGQDHADEVLKRRRSLHEGFARPNAEARVVNGFVGHRNAPFV
jgi:hypothetical protein